MVVTHQSNERAPARGITVRPATMAELPELIDLDAKCFGSGNPEDEVASPGELALGVRSGRTLVAVQVDDGVKQVLGFAQYHVDDSPEDAYIAGLAVHPDHRKLGLGRQLLDACTQAIETAAGTVPVTMSVAPGNLPMLRLATSAGFVGTHFVEDYYGPDRSRVVFSTHGLHAHLRHTERLLIPFPNEAILRDRLDSSSWQLAGVRELPHGPTIELQRFLPSERTTMMANESSVSVSFSAVIIGALAVLAGFGLANAKYPPDLIAHMILGLIATLIALIVYANSTSELSELNFDRFEQFMETGNIISEFGGVFPMLHVLPVSVAAITDNTVVGVTTCLGACVASLLYQRSPFDILDRYNNDPWLFRSYTAYLVVSPALGLGSWLQYGTTSLWSILNTAMLCLIMFSCVRRVSLVDVSLRPDRRR